MWKRLLVPVDFSECSARALDVAARFAERERAALTLLHVSPLPPNLPPEAVVTPPGATRSLRIDEYATHGALERLESIARPLRDRGFDVRTIAVASTSGEIADDVVQTAVKVGAEVIFVGTHGRTGLSHFLLGSVAEKVIRRATVPVLVVRAAAPEAALTREEELAEDELAG
jgi:nucleotide-binding universal stress UspA family protein